MKKNIERLLGTFLRGEQGASLSGRLMKGGVGSFAMKLGSIGLGFVVATVLARVMGAEDFGIYSYVFALVLLTAIPAEFGLSALVVRETAKADAQADWALMRGVWRWATFAVAMLAVTFAVVGCIAGWLSARHFSTVELATLAFGLVLVPMIALGNLRGAALQGLGRVVIGQLPEAILRPALLLILLAAAILILGMSRATSPAFVMGLHAAAAAMAFSIGAMLLWRYRPTGVVECKQATYHGRSWLTATMPLALMGGMLVVNQQVGIIVLGIFRPVEDVGVYKIVMQGSGLITFGMQAVNTVAAPYFSRFHAQGDRVRLQTLARRSARFSLMFALPMLIMCTVWGESLLAFIFGPQFAEGYAALVILAVGYTLSVAIGLANSLLNMTGFEKETARGVFVAVLVNVALTLVLTPALGMNGAATAAALSLVVWKLQLWYVARRRLGLETAAISLARRRRECS